jgi:hypothetical protein
MLSVVGIPHPDKGWHPIRPHTAFHLWVVWVFCERSILHSVCKRIYPGRRLFTSDMHPAPHKQSAWKPSEPPSSRVPANMSSHFPPHSSIPERPRSSPVPNR